MATAERPLTLVTGGTRGIGAAIGRRLAAAGHDLVLGFAHDDASAELTRAAVEEEGARCTVVCSDLTKRDGIDALFAGAEPLGCLTGVVNNAGATLHVGPLAHTSVDIVERTIDLNLTCAILVARAAVRTMGLSFGGTGGVLVNISSSAATRGAAGEYVHYAAAKAGVDALTLGLAEEVADDGIRVVGVAPGMVRTRIHEDAGEPGRLERVARAIPLRRAGEPEEIAEAVAWLMSGAASYVTGATLRVAGGR